MPEGNPVPKRIAIILLLALPCALGQQPAPKHPSDAIVCTLGMKQTGKILKMVKPTYPAEAKRKGISGPVTVDFTIDKRGQPKAFRVSKGDPLLAEAVLSAVRQWRWNPYKLSNKAVEVTTMVTVNFELHRP
jgi:protein TonB